MGVMYIVLYLMNLINCRGSCACFFSRPSSFLLLSKTRITPSPTLKSHVISPVWILEFDSEKYHPQLCLTREHSLETPNGAEHLEGAAGAENFLLAVTTAGKGKILPRSASTTASAAVLERGTPQRVGLGGSFPST